MLFEFNVSIVRWALQRPVLRDIRMDKAGAN